MSLSSSTGLSSGIDYNSIITQLHNLNAQPITLIQKKEQDIQTKASSLGTINKALTDFKTATDAVSTKSNFVSLSATTSDATVLGASVGDGPSAGTYSINVLQLAQAERDAAQGVATSDTTSISTAGGLFKFTAGSGVTTSITVTPGMTLQQLRDSINNSQNSGVHASIINDGSVTNPYRLVLSAGDTGAANAIKIQQNDTILNFSTPTIEPAAAAATNTYNGTIASSGSYTGTSDKNVIMQITTPGALGTAKYKVSTDGGLTWSADNAFTTSAGNVDVTGSAAQGINISFADSASPNSFALGDTFTVDATVPQLQKAQDAKIQADGVLVTRSSNTFDNVIEGVSLTASKVSTTPQSLTVTSKPGDVQSKISSFVSTFNTLVDAVNTATKYDTSSNTAAPLFGDSGVRAIVSDIRSRINTTVGGLSTYSTLSDVGVSFDDAGHLNIDSTKLSTALSTNPGDVAKLFVEAGASDNSAVQFTSSTTDTLPGTYAVNITQAASQASVTGSQVVGAGGLTADERLTISYGTSDAVQVNLTAGQSLTSMIQQLNSSFGSNGLPLLAQSDGGKLNIISTAYGSTETVGIFSNQDAATAGQLGFGTALQSNTGLDVQGTVNGFGATGVGQNLTVGSGDGNGLKLLITSKTPTTSTVRFTQGVGLTLQRYIASETDETNGFFTTRTNSWNAQITSYETQISTLNDRLTQQDADLKKQFTDLETKLATLQSQGSFLLSQLSSISGTTSSK